MVAELLCPIFFLTLIIWWDVNEGLLLCKQWVQNLYGVAHKFFETDYLAHHIQQPIFVTPKLNAVFPFKDPPLNNILPLNSFPFFSKYGQNQYKFESFQ